MSHIVPELEETFKDFLKKLVDLTDEEIEAFLFLQSCLAVDPRFSLVRASKASKGRYDRKMLVELLNKYCPKQDVIFQALCHAIVKQFGRRSRIYLALDDHLVQKAGKKIYGVNRWVDHNLRRKVLSFCIVDVALVIKGQAVCILPYLLLESSVPVATPPNAKSKTTQEQDAKTDAAMMLLTKVVTWLEEVQVGRTKIGVLADAWFSNQRFLAFVRGMKLRFRIAGKKSYQVHLPHSKRIQRRKKGGRGRRPSRYVRTRRLEVHMKTVKKRGSFLDPKTGKRVQWKMAVVTLDTGGRTRVYSFWREGCKEPKFILTPATPTDVPTAQTVYRDYSYRWPIEECHRDLKQQFGLRKLRNRKEDAVLGFLGLVYACYSIFLLTRQKGLAPLSHRVTAPQYQDEMMTRMYVERGVTFT